MCVIVRKATIEYVANLERGSAIYWGRGDGRFEGVGITPRPEKVRWEQYFSGLPRDDMSYWIPLYLATPHLAAAMRALWHEGECQPAVTEPLPAPVVAPPARGSVDTPAAEKDRAKLVSEEYDRIQASIAKKTAAMRRKEAERNGVHSE